MKRIWPLLIISTLSLEGNANTVCFSDSARLYLLTVSQGSGLDQSWGHSAIWLIDSLKKVDFVFEYTSTEKMRWLSNIKLLFGTETHRLRITDLKTFEKETHQSPQIISYQLILKDRQSIEVIYRGLLRELQTRKTFPYTLTSSNCSSLIFDHLSDFAKPRTANSRQTIRSTFRTDGELTMLEEVIFVDIFLSLAADRTAAQTAPFTPKSLATAFAHAPNIPLGSRFEWLSLAIVLSMLGLAGYYYPKLYIQLMVWVSGALGILLFVAFLCANDPILKNNHQLLWLNPLGVLAIAFRVKPDKRYLQFFTTMLLLSLVISLVSGHKSVPYLTCCLSVLCINTGLIVRSEI